MLASNLVEWREIVINRDDFTCQICGEEGNIADHIISKTRNPSLRLETNNGRSLCSHCHGKYGDKVHRIRSDVIIGGIVRRIRRVYRVGGSLMVSLPSEWVKTNNISKGEDLVYIITTNTLNYISISEEKI